jgi:hypothetical protein
MSRKLNNRFELNLPMSAFGQHNKMPKPLLFQKLLPTHICKLIDRLQARNVPWNIPSKTTGYLFALITALITKRLILLSPSNTK